MGRRARSLVLSALLASAACSSGSPPTTAANPWIRNDLKPVTQPAAVAHRFLVLDASGADLKLLALDARTGKTVWSDTVSTSDISPGEAPELIVVGTSVIYLHATGTSAELVSADAATGHIVWKSEARTFNGWPSICSDDASLVCATGPLASSSKNASLLRFNAQTGGLQSGAAISGVQGARELAPGLFDTGNRKPEELAAARSGALAWTHAIAGIFTLRGASTDFGWDFVRAEGPGLFVGSPGWPPIASTSTTYTLDLGRTMTAGFKIADGATVWRDQGTQLICGYIPCPGENLVPYRGPADASDPGPTVGLRLRMTGTVSGSQSDESLPKPSQDARGVLEGFDPATGKSTWTFDIGHQVDLLSQALLPPLVGKSSIVISDPSGAIKLLDLESGTATDPPDSLLAWCRTIVSYKHRSAEGSNSDYIGQLGLFPCDTHQHRVPPPTRAPGYVGSLGGASDGLVAWSEAAAVVAVRAAG